MSDVKWIKITTDIFEDDKIMLIESMPKGDAMLVIWFKLLCLAGKQNNSGVFTIGDKIPYTTKMLSTAFRRKEAIVKQALEVFIRFGMVQMVDDVITIPNWGKHQSLDRLEKKNKYMRGYMKDYRKKQKEKARLSSDSANGKTNRKANVSDTELEREREQEREREGNTTTNRDSLSFYESEFEALTPAMIQSIESMETEHGEELTLEAMKVAVEQGTRNIAYIQGILRNWKVQGYQTAEEARKGQADFRKARQKPQEAARTNLNQSFRGEQVIDDFDDIYEVC